MQQRFRFVSAAYLFIINDGKVLLQRRVNTGYEDGNYGVPAGHLEGNESVRAGCAREIKEEIGVMIDPEDLTVVHVLQRKGPDDERIEFFLVATKYSGDITNTEPEKCDDLRFFALDALPLNTIGFVRQALEHYLAGVQYSEYGYMR